jgi:glycolate oxidase
MFNREEKRENEAAQKAVRAIFTVVRELDGTLSGEHGIGITKSPYIGMELSEATIALSLRLKKAFDPNNIMNPGKIFYPGDSSTKPGKKRDLY